MRKNYLLVAVKGWLSVLDQCRVLHLAIKPGLHQHHLLGTTNKSFMIMPDIRQWPRNQARDIKILVQDMRVLGGIQSNDRGMLHQLALCSCTPVLDLNIYLCVCSCHSSVLALHGVKQQVSSWVALVGL
eukprot:3938589-Rhodomonas_salina.2